MTTIHNKDDRSLHMLLNLWSAAANHPDAERPPTYSGPDITITNIVEHTGHVEEGSCFVARVRTGTDGHPYIPQAITSGAKLIIGQYPRSQLGFDIPDGVVYLQCADSAAAMAWLAAAWHNFPSRDLTVIGITGTDGKTSTIDILFSILKAGGLRSGLISTIKAVFGEKEEPTGLHVTTPSAPAVQGYLRRMVDAGLTHCILETTSHGLAQHRVTAVEFDMALVTNITHEHIDYHGSHAAYVAAKRRLFELVARQPHGVAVLNRDDDSYEWLKAAAGPSTLTYGIRLPANYMATDLAFTAQTTQFTLNKNETDGHPAVQIESELLGQFNIYNMLCAIATAEHLGVSRTAIQNGVAALKEISGRMQRISAGQPFLIVVDFAHTPNALAKAIEAARPMIDRSGRVITVFGSAGKRDIEKRRLMAEISAMRADITVLTAEDPRTEPLEDILDMMAAGCRSKGAIEGNTFWRVPDRGEAIYFALKLAKKEDIVLVCGKGHEQSMCFVTTEYPWDDRDATRMAVQAYLANEPMIDLGLPTFGTL